MELHWLSLTEASALIGRGDLSPREYTEALIQRIEAVDSTLNVFVTFEPERALEEATLAEREIAAGRLLGPLHGIPIGVKDMIDVAGLPTTACSRVLRDNVANRDSVVVGRLRKAGAIVLGKTTAHEFAIGGPSFDLPWPPARNPWRTDHHPGGSSSGCGAGVASGCFPASIGTDTGGSVRNPASATGIVGMKPTYDLVSRKGVIPLSFSLDHVGPLTRSVNDSELVLGAMFDRSNRTDRILEHAETDLSSASALRIGVARRWHESDVVATPEMIESIDRGVQALASHGASIVEVDPGPLSEFTAASHVIRMSEAFAIHERNLASRRDDYGELARRRISTGSKYSACDYVQALRQRRVLCDRWNDATRSVDVVIAASSMEPACKIRDLAQFERSYFRQARSPMNLTGAPAMAIPTGVSTDGLPLSLQVVGRPYDESSVYQAAKTIETELGIKARPDVPTADAKDGLAGARP